MGGAGKSLRRRTEGIVLFVKQFYNACVGACAELPTMRRWVGSRGRVPAWLRCMACAQKRMCRAGTLLISILGELPLCIDAPLTCLRRVSVGSCRRRVAGLLRMGRGIACKPGTCRGGQVRRRAEADFQEEATSISDHPSEAPLH